MKVAFIHAHPDDETLASGALIAHLVDNGVEVSLLTATRGERGEVVPGPLAALAGPAELETHRMGELAGAVASLGISHHSFLGDPPTGSGRRYRDSGMRWIRPGLAGPDASAEPDSLCRQLIDDEVADLCAWLRFVGAEMVISYDEAGGYGHPDHVRTHEICVAACQTLGLPFAALVHTQGEDVHWFELASLLPRVEAALRHHASQLTVNGDGTLTHSGGQTEPVTTSVGLKPAAIAAQLLG